MDIVKKTYNTPELTVYGDVREITQGGASGLALDADFNAGTSFSDLTFS